MMRNGYTQLDISTVIEIKGLLLLNIEYRMLNAECRRFHISTFGVRHSTFNILRGGNCKYQPSVMIISQIDTNE